MTKILTNEQVKEAVALYEVGFSITEIADRYPVTRQAIWRLVRTRTSMRTEEGLPGAQFNKGTRANDRAQGVLERAIKRGEIVRPTACEECGDEPGMARDGRSKIDGHHDDYSRPLDARWLCRKCHLAWHRENIAEGAFVR